ncbi:MAG TPA: FKBP-type peptidyl-prolyl cis-trans isomerase [Caulobacteraceae bacterium]|jgi:peptidylprolyl isomerase/FKBP-type peptidyl-prolyl cis-trans isomerase FklB|nr:FKBP-type peptidyl-prolyl cis-trans isomerase [Caulobacteraceae bacterium]
MIKKLVLVAALAALAACSPKPRDSGEGLGPFAPRDGGGSAKTVAAGQAFLAKNAKQPGVVTLPSGLQYKIVREGPPGGVHPKPQDEVKVHYEGTLLDGTVFDSSYKHGQPVVFTLGGLIPGWVEGIQLMKPGDEFMLYVPSKLGYGDSEAGPIPPGSTLVFRIELLGVLQHSTGLG